MLPHPAPIVLGPEWPRFWGAVRSYTDLLRLAETRFNQRHLDIDPFQSENLAN